MSEYAICKHGDAGEAVRAEWDNTKVLGVHVMDESHGDTYGSFFCASETAPTHTCNAECWAYMVRYGCPVECDPFTARAAAEEYNENPDNWF